MSERSADLFAALDYRQRRSRKANWTKGQRDEMVLRRGRASSQAKTALARLHPQEYKALYEEVLRRMEEQSPIEEHE